MPSAPLNFTFNDQVRNMFPFTTIKKRYAIQREMAEVISRLDDIVSKGEWRSSYSVYGEKKSDNPPRYSLKSNAPVGNVGASLWPTTVLLEVCGENGITRLDVTTKSNLYFVMCTYFTAVASFMVFVFSKNAQDFINASGLLCVAAVFIFLDRFSKKLLLVYLERDIKFT